MDKTIQVERVAFYALLINLAVGMLDLVMAALSGSLALAAETIHNLVDVIASLAVLGGLVIAKRKSSSFPYGLYKVENVVSVGVALLVFLTGFEIAQTALASTARHVAVQPIMLLGIGLSALVSWLFSRYELRAGRQSNSPSLLASGQDFKGHVLSSGVVLAAVGGQLLGWPLDRPAALIVVIWIAHMGWTLLVDGMRVLLDASVDVQTLDSVRQLIQSEPGVTKILSVTGRNSGRFRFLEAVVELNTTDLEQAHRLSQRIEEHIRADVPHVERVLIHCEPARKDVLRYAVPLLDQQGTVSTDFGDAAYYALVDVGTAGEIIGQEIIANPYRDLGRGRGLKVAQDLVNRRVDVVAVAEDLQGKGPGYALAANNVRLLSIMATNLSEATNQMTQDARVRGTSRDGTGHEAS